MEIPLIGEKIDVRKTVGDYRIGREAMVVQNTYCEENILDSILLEVNKVFKCCKVLPVFPFEEVPNS